MRIPWNSETKLFVLIFLAVILVIAILAFIIELIRRRNKQQIEAVVLQKEEVPAPAPTRFITALSLNTDNVRKEYIIGDEFCADGLIVRAHYNKEPLVEEITGYEIRPVDMNQEGTPVVLISYADKNVGFEISIKPVGGEKVVAEEVVAEPVIIVDEDYDAILSRYNRSFTSRLIQSDDEVKAWYTTLKNDLLSYKKVRDRMSWKRESYRYGRIQFAKFCFRGKTLCLLLPLNAAEFEGTKYKVEDISETNAYAETPCMYRIKNPRRVKFAMELIALVAERLGISRIEREAVDYYLPYEEDAPLIARGLIKYNGNDAGDLSIAEISKTNATEEVIGEVEVDADVTDTINTIDVIDSEDLLDEDSDELNDLFMSRYNRSFTSRLIQSDDEVKAWYTDLKNDLLSYKKVRARMSWKRESYRVGRLQFAKFAFRGKTLCLFLPLNAAEFEDTKYKVEDISETNAYAETPCMYRIKNPRRVKFAMELIALVAERLGVARIEHEAVDYYLPYEEDAPLLARGLIKYNGNEAGDLSITEIIRTHATEEVDDVATNNVDASVEPEVFNLETFGLGYKWIYEGKIITTPELVGVLNEKTTITEDDVIKSIRVVIKNMDKLGKDTCEVDEEEETFNFYICKGEDDFDIIDDSKDETITETVVTETVSDETTDDALVVDETSVESTDTTDEVVDTTTEKIVEEVVVIEEVDSTVTEVTDDAVVAEEVADETLEGTPIEAVVEEIVETVPADIISETIVAEPGEAVVDESIIEEIIVEEVAEVIVDDNNVEDVIVEDVAEVIVEEHTYGDVEEETPEVINEEAATEPEITEAVVDEVTEEVTTETEPVDDTLVETTDASDDEVVNINEDVADSETVEETVSNDVDLTIVEVCETHDTGDAVTSVDPEVSTIDYKWIYSGKEMTTDEIVEVIKEKTTITEDEVIRAVKVVMKNMDKLAKTTCKVTEEDETFSFHISKGEDNFEIINSSNDESTIETIVADTTTEEINEESVTTDETPVETADTSDEEVVDEVTEEVIEETVFVDESIVETPDTTDEEVVDEVTEEVIEETVLADESIAETPDTTDEEVVDEVTEETTETVDETIVDIADEDDDSNTDDADDFDDETIIVTDETTALLMSRYNRSFTARLIQSTDEVKGWYGALKNDLLSYKKARARMSWKRESFRIGRLQFAKFAFRGKTLCLFLPLNPAEFADTKYLVEDMSEVSIFAETPCMYRIKNSRRVKYAMELIALVAERLGVARIEHEAVDYYLPYEDLETLIERDLIRVNDRATGSNTISEGTNKTLEKEVVISVDDISVDDVNDDVKVDSDGLTWTVDGNTLTTTEMLDVLKEKTTLTEEDILKAVKVVIMHMDKLGKKDCEIREDNESLYFVIKK